MLVMPILPLAILVTLLQTFLVVELPLFVIPQQMYHYNVALQSSGGKEPSMSQGYSSYSQLTEMWDAANATKTNLIGICGGYQKPSLLKSTREQI
jgi:hypothetical protein